MFYVIYNRTLQTTTSLILKLRLLSIICYLVIVLMPFSTGDKSSELRKEILSHYNKTISPGFETTPSDVGVIVYVTRITEFDDYSSTMTVESLLVVNWFDRRLKWEDDDTYNNISCIHAKPDNVWKPKYNVFNSCRAHEYMTADLPLLICKDGRIYWVLDADLNFVCVKEDLRWYPLDTHVCKIRLGSLYPQSIFSRTLLNYDKASREIENSRIVENPHWDLLKANISEGMEVVNEVMIYPTDDFTLEVFRQGWALLAAFLPLMLSFIFLSWSSLALPPHGDLLSKRMAVSTTSLFLSSVFLLVLIKTVPGVGTRPPVIIKIFISFVFLEFFTCFHNVILANILPKSSTHLPVLRKLPNKVRYILGLQDKSADANRLLENEESPQDVGIQQFEKETVPEANSYLVGSAYDRVQILLQATIVILVISFLCLA